MIVVIDKLIFVHYCALLNLRNLWKFQSARAQARAPARAEAFLARAFDLARPGVAPPLDPGLPPGWKRPSGRPSHTWLRAVEADLGQQKHWPCICLEEGSYS